MACAAAAVLHPCGGCPLAAHPRRRSAAPGGGQQQSYAERVLVRLGEGEPVKVSSENIREMGLAKLVARLLATGARRVRIQTSLINTKWAI